MLVDRIGYLTLDEVSQSIKPSIAQELSDTFQPLSPLLSSYSAANWSAGVQLPTLTASNVVALRTVGAGSATDILDRAAGDGRYAALGSGVLSFNSRTGNVTLLSADVTAALGYTPTSVTGLTGVYTVAAFKTGLSLVKADVGLSLADNTADITKNVLSATKLTTARNINGVAFDGTTDITINAVDATARVPTTRTISTTSPLTGGGDLSADRTLAITGSALTKTDDTNVTLALGGTPASALLTAVSLTLGWAGTLSVARGGTGGGSASGTLLDNITGFSGIGHLVRTGAGAYTVRTMTGTTGEIVVTDGSGTSGNPTLSLPATLVLSGKQVNGAVFAQTATGTGPPALGAAASASNVAGFFTNNAGLYGLEVCVTGATGDVSLQVGRVDGTPTAFNLRLNPLGGVVEVPDIYPLADDTYYLGRNSNSSPKAWKGIILRDQVSGTRYRITVQSGALVLTSL